MSMLLDILEAATLTKIAKDDSSSDIISDINNKFKSVLHNKTESRRAMAGTASLVPGWGPFLAATASPKGTGWSTFLNANPSTFGLGAYVGSNPKFNTKRSLDQETKDVALTSVLGTGLGAGFAANEGRGFSTGLGGTIGMLTGGMYASKLRKLINSKSKVISPLVTIGGSALGSLVGATGTNKLMQLIDGE